MDVEVMLYQDEDRVWIAECPSIPGCVSQGATEDEAMENVKDAIQGCLDVRKELGLPAVAQRRTVRISG